MEPLFPDVVDANGVSFTDAFYDPWAEEEGE
jgi:hypothetical protein